MLQHLEGLGFAIVADYNQIILARLVEILQHEDGCVAWRFTEVIKEFKSILHRFSLLTWEVIPRDCKTRADILTRHARRNPCVCSIEDLNSQDGYWRPPKSLGLDFKYFALFTLLFDIMVEADQHW